MTKAENIRNQCMKILDKYDADYRGVTVERINGTTYVVFKYYGGTNDTVDRNDDSWDEMFELDGVVDVGYGEGYGIEGKYEDSLLIELDDSIVESKTSNKKSLKESKSSFTVFDICSISSWNRPCEIWSTDGRRRYDSFTTNYVYDSSYRNCDVDMWDVQKDVLILYISKLA